MKLIFSHLVNVIFSFSIALPAYAQLLPSVQTLRSHTRIRIPLDQGVDYQLEKSSDGFALTFKGITFSEMGAPLGEESQWAESLSQRFADERLQSAKWTSLRDAVRLSGVWKFPNGSDAPAHPKMEVFEYRDKKTGELIIDFWVGKSPTVAQVETQKKIKRQKESNDRVRAEAKYRQNRKIASVKARAAFEDALQICNKPSSDSLIILPFRPFIVPFKITEHFDENYPDADYAYWTPTANLQEDEYLKLALKLYKDEKYALVLRTIDFFKKDSKINHKISAHEVAHELEFLRANALIKLKLKDEGVAVLEEIAKGDPKAHQTLYATMFLAMRAFSAGNWASSQERYLWLIQNHPAHRLAWVFHRSLAEAFYNSQQFDAASKEFQWVAQNGPTAKERAAGALRQSDVALAKRQYESALAAYFQAQSAHPTVEASHPAFLINRSEVLYQLGETKRAHQGFNSFLQKFPSHPEGWRALLRVAELDLMNKETQEIGRERLVEVVNRFPASSGALLARAALIPCGNHMGLDWFGANRFYQNELAVFQSEEFFLENIKLLRILARVRGVIGMLSKHNDMELATQVLESSLKEMGAGYPQARGWVGQLFTTLFRKRVLTLIEDQSPQSKIKALRYYADHKDYAFGIEDPDYLLKLALAANELDLGVYGSELTERYFQAREKYLKKNRELASVNDEEIDLEERLKRAERSYVQASGLWITKGLQEKKQISTLLKDVMEESEYSLEKEIILGLMAQKEEKFATALGHALKADVLWSKRAGIEQERVRFWLAGLHSKAGDASVAISIYQTMAQTQAPSQTHENIKGDQLGLPRAPSREVLLFSAADLLEKKKLWGEAAQLYSLATQSESVSDRASYDLGRVLLKTGVPDDREKGIEIWKKLAQSKKDEFWNRLAREALATEVQQ